MRNPLDQMQLRTPSTDPTIKRAFGGAFGPGVRGPDKAHQGWDLLADKGTPAYAIAKGTIEGTYGDLPGYGVAVVLKFSFRGATLYAIYGHLSQAYVQKNDPVTEGHVIGATGQSGNAGGTAPHLHFGIMTSAIPQKGLKTFISPGHILGYGSVRGLTTDDHVRLDSA